MGNTELEDHQSSLMSNHFNPNRTYNREHRQPEQLAAFLLRMGPMQPPIQQELVVDTANHMLDNATPGPVDLHDGKEKIDLQLRTQQVAPTNHPLSKSYSAVPS
jgi:hypothetical protein